MTREAPGSATLRAIEVGVILAAVQGGSLSYRQFEKARQAAGLKVLLTHNGMRGRAVDDGLRLLDVLRSLRGNQVSADEFLIRGDPARAGLLERGYEIGRPLFHAPPFAASGMRRLLKLLARYFPRGVEVDEMIAAIEARLMDGAVPYFTGKLAEFAALARWDARSSLRRLRERIETFRDAVRDGGPATPPLSTPALVQLFERLGEAERRIFGPSGLPADRSLFFASTEYLTGRHGDMTRIASTEYDATPDEAPYLFASGKPVRAFRLGPSLGLLTVADVHFHLQASFLRGATFVPRLGVDYVLRVANAKQVNVLSSNPSVIKLLLICRMLMVVRTGAPGRCVSTLEDDRRADLNRQLRYVA